MRAASLPLCMMSLIRNSRRRPGHPAGCEREILGGEPRASNGLTARASPITGVAVVLEVGASRADRLPRAR